MSLRGGRIAGVDRARGGDKQKIVISLPSGDTACARTPAGQGWSRLTKAGDNTFAPAADSRFCKRVFHLAQS